jgi:ParB family transcriptional regulator, chromosome partitioning protein
MTKKGLGRGLDSLIPKKKNSDDYSDFSLDKKNSLSFANENQIININPDKIKVNPRQPRQNFDPVSLNSLVESIKEHGIIQPLVVSPKEDYYELIAGERRWRSAIELKLKKVPVIIREVDEQEKLELALIENIQREDLNPIESAIAYRQLINEFNLTQEELAKRLSKARSSITNTLRFLALPEEIKEALIKKKISEAHAKYISGLDNEVKQLNIFRKIIYNNLSVKDTNKLIKRGENSKKKKEHVYNNYSSEESLLREALNTKVSIKKKGKGGKIEIAFYESDDLNEIVKIITRK